jgi:hypothetical protein
VASVYTHGGCTPKQAGGGAGLIGIDLQEHVADAQGRVLTMSDDNLDLHHATHPRSRRPSRHVFACDGAVSRSQLPRAHHRALDVTSCLGPPASARQNRSGFFK